MQFPGIWEILEPFLRGAIRRPKEAPFQKGSRIFNMATSYYNISLDHLADGCCVTSHCTAVLSSCHPLTVPPSCHLITQAGCRVASRCAILSSSCRAALSSSHRPLTAPSSHRLIAQACSCVTFVAPPSRPLVMPHSCPLIAPPSHRLIVPSGCCVFMELHS